LYADSPDRYLAARCWRLGWLEREGRALIAREVQRDMVAVDVGANIGLHTLGLAHAVGPTGRVHALEPDPRNFRLLARAVAEAGLQQVRLHQVAAANESGPVTLHLSPVNRGDHRVLPTDEPRATIGVKAVTLDELLATEPRVDFVKIDVQGAEAAVLRGATETLRRSATLRILCEVCPALLRQVGVGRGEFFAPLREVGHVPHVLERGTLRAVTEETAWSMAESGVYADLYFRRA